MTNFTPSSDRFILRTEHTDGFEDSRMSAKVGGCSVLNRIIHTGTNTALSTTGTQS